MDNLADGMPSAALAGLVGELSSYLGDVSAGLLGKLTDADVLAELREFEVLRRRLAVVDHALVAELGRRALAGRLALGSTSALLQAALRLSPYEARQRVTASQACGPRWGLTGEQLETLLPDVAAAQAAGVVSSEHARVIASTLDELPSSVDPADVSAAEQQLVRAAAQLRPARSACSGSGSWPT